MVWMTNSDNETILVIVSWTVVFVYRFKNMKKPFEGTMIKPSQCHKSLVIEGQIKLTPSTSSMVMQQGCGRVFVASLESISDEKNYGFLNE